MLLQTALRSVDGMKDSPAERGRHEGTLSENDMVISRLAKSILSGGSVHSTSSELSILNTDGRALHGTASATSTVEHSSERSTYGASISCQR